VNPRITAALPIAGSNRRAGFSAAAFSGLTPQVLALIAALLLARVLGVPQGLGDLVNAVNEHALGDWLFRLITGYALLLVMAAPMLIIIVATANLGPQQGPGRVAALAIALVSSTVVGVFLRSAAFVVLGFDIHPDKASTVSIYVWGRYVLLGGMLIVAAEFYRRETASIKAIQQAELDGAAFERDLAEARLEVMQAQIEPHFLFNTLANVRRLYDKDSVAGQTMLENLMRYLQVALPRMREHRSTLERDWELIEAFLRIQQIRMGQRLRFSIDIPPSLRGHPVPTMVLLPLVENAIKHGINPSPQGGLVRVAARCEGETLILSVADTGVGFAPGSGGGIGLANVRARLAAQFGETATLALENNDVGGATATIVLPLTDEWAR